MTDNDRALMTRWLYFVLVQPPASLSPRFTTHGKSEIKWRENYCFLGLNFVPLHQQSKEQPIVPKGGHNRRPQLGLNDGRRRSSIKTQNRVQNEGFRVVVIQWTLKHRTEYD